MQLKKFKIFWISALFGVVACGSGPKVSVCISDGDKGFDCVDKKKKEFFIEYSKSLNYVAFNPDDFEKLINYYKLKLAECQK